MGRVPQVSKMAPDSEKHYLRGGKKVGKYSIYGKFTSQPYLKASFIELQRIPCKLHWQQFPLNRNQRDELGKWMV